MFNDIFSRKGHGALPEQVLANPKWEEPKIKTPKITPAICGTPEMYEQYRGSYQDYSQVVPAKVYVNTHTKEGTLIVTSKPWDEWFHGRTDEIPSIISNRDHISSMSDEELAKFLKSCNGHSDRFLCEGAYHVSCDACWKEWLGQVYHPEDAIWNKEKDDAVP